MRQILHVIILATPLWAFGQKKNVHGLPIPKDLIECFSTLDKSMPDNEVNLIRTLPEDSIWSHEEFRFGTDFFHAWKLYDGSRLTKYFNKMGLVGSNEIYEAILISYHRHLNKIEIDLEGQIKKYQAKQKAHYDRYLSKLDKDSLNGVYIPKDINECMTELDRLMDQKSKDDFTKQEESKAVSLAYRPGPGLWMRNNWGLWGGSRLQKYFFDKGVKDPEGISWIILTCYHRYRNGKPLDFEEQLKTTK